MNDFIYPLRRRIVRSRICPYVFHPNYHANGCCTPAYLDMLAHYKVSVCTTSIFGYALRKIVESTAAGCVVITDLPAEDRLPEIDDNLVRIPYSANIGELRRLIHRCVTDYDADRQRHYAERACAWYDWREVGRRLAEDIEKRRISHESI